MDNFFKGLKSGIETGIKKAPVKINKVTIDKAKLARQFSSASGGIVSEKQLFEALENVSYIQTSISKAKSLAKTPQGKQLVSNLKTLGIANFGPGNTSAQLEDILNFAVKMTDPKKVALFTKISKHYKLGIGVTLGAIGLGIAALIIVVGITPSAVALDTLSAEETKLLGETLQEELKELGIDVSQEKIDPNQIEELIAQFKETEKKKETEWSPWTIALIVLIFFMLLGFIFILIFLMSAGRPSKVSKAPKAASAAPRGATNYYF